MKRRRSEWKRGWRKKSSRSWRIREEKVERKRTLVESQPEKH